jgi:type I restriction enzyme S subunit
MTGIELAKRMTDATPSKKLRTAPVEPDLKIPETWSWSAIANIAQIRGGIQKQPHRAPKSNAYNYLRVANVMRDRLDLTELSRFELADGELETYRLQYGDLLVVEGNGSFNEIGRASIWRNEVQDCVHQNHIIRVRFNGLIPEFVNFFWNSPIGIEQVSATAVTTSGLYSLSTGKIGSLMIPVPGKSEQVEIVRRIESLFALADSIESRLAEATAQVERTTQAILAKAFRGELT